jgi:hypothetical protein
MSKIKTVNAVKAVNTIKAVKAVKQDFITANNIKVMDFNKDIHGKIDKQQFACACLVLQALITGKMDITLKLISVNAQVIYYRHNASAKVTHDGHNANRIYLVNALKGMTDTKSCHSTWTNKAMSKLAVNALVWGFAIKNYASIHGISKSDIISALNKAKSQKDNAYKGYADIIAKMA